jgi:RNA polymerase sigma-70 factor (ECF subfamily)
MFEVKSSGSVACSSPQAKQSLRLVHGGMQRETFDREYVQRLIEGDPDTERHFFDYFSQLLWIKLRYRLRDPQLVEDVRQETLVRVITALKTKHALHSPEKLGAFVNAVCTNLLFEVYRREARRRSTIGELDEFDTPDERASIESEMVTEERRQQVRRILEELPSNDRKLLRMIFYEGIDRAEICKQLHVEREYLRVLVHRAKARFRECLLKQRAAGDQAHA